MADIPINAVHRRIQYTSTGSAGPYSFAFAILDEGDLAVYDSTTLKTLTTHYTVSLNTDGTGSITFTSGNEPTSSNIVTITSDQAVARTSDFTTGGDFKAATINDELDRITIIQQQLESLVRRCIQLDAFANRDISDSGAGPLAFPYASTPADQADKFIIFDSAGTALTTSSTIALPSSLSGKAANMIRVNSGETAYEFRTAVQVTADLGAVSASSTDTLTNKTFDLTDNTLTGTLAELNTAISDATIVDLDNSDTMENKTLTAPVLTSPVINTSVTGTAFLNEDNFASNSDTKLASQQSIKAYVDALVSANGGNWKASARCASTANLTLSGEQTIDGVTTTTDRILVKDQSSGAENGIYVTAASAWARAADADTFAELVSMAIFIEEGTVAADTSYICTNNEGGTLDSTSVVYTQFGVGGGGGGGWLGESGVPNGNSSDSIRINTQTLSNNQTMLGTDNGSCTGPFSIASGVTLTINSGATFKVI